MEHNDPNPKQASNPPGNTQKDPDDWVSGDDRMTGAQASYLKTLSEQAGTEFNPELNKAEASKQIDALREKTGQSESIAGGNPGQTPNAQEPQGVDDEPTIQRS